MVLEHLFPDALLERKEWSAFVLAFIYATVAIIISRLLFPANSGIVSVVFVSIFLIPYFSTVLKREERQEAGDAAKGFWGILRDNADAIRTYLFIFFGIYLAYMLYSFLAPLFGFDVSRVFREQLSLEVVRGGATFSFMTFTDILLNNWWVLLACFLVALIAGDGAIFFVAWNASAWGTIFGYRAIASSGGDLSSALISLLIILLITLPHVLLEGGAYILAAIAGGVMSDLTEETREVQSFVIYLIASILAFVVLYAVLRLTIGSMPLLMGLLAIGVVLSALHLLQFVFANAKDRAVFRYNYSLFLLAIGIFVIGALVETFVLYNATLLQQVYDAALFAG